MSETKQREIVYDVLLIGAGVSSSNAAYVLRKRCKNMKMLVVEAKDRVGGRTFTVDIPSSKPNQTSKWDLGAQWVTDSQKNVTKLIKELNIETYKQYTDGNKVLESNGKITVFNTAFPYSTVFSYIDMMMYMKRVDKDIHQLNTIYPYENAELAQRLESQTLQEYLYSKAFTPTVRSIIRSNMSTAFGHDASQVNALFGCLFLKSGGGSVEAITLADEGCGQEKRVKGGTQQISIKCLDHAAKESETPEDFKLLLNTIVIEIKQNEIEDNEPVEIITQNTLTGKIEIFKARKVISSLPINQYSKVTFKPQLPFVKRNLFKYYQPGNYMKCIITYKRAFWREKGFSGQGTFDGSCKWLDEDKFREAYKDTIKKRSFHRKMPTMGAAAECWDGTDEHGEPALIAFIAGQPVVEWADQKDELREKEVIEDLVRLFGVEARNYVKYVDKHWSDEPFNNGCPCFSVISAGCMKDFARATREPFLNIHFCGSDTATEWQGYMDGAVQSGERVANEVLYSMYANTEKSKTIHIDYEKTFYHQRDLINAIEAKQAQEKMQLKPHQSILKLILKCLPIIGAGSLIVFQFKYDLANFGLMKLTKKFII